MMFLFPPRIFFFYDAPLKRIKKGEKSLKIEIFLVKKYIFSSTDP